MSRSRQDDHIVETGPITELLRDFVAGQMRERPPTTNRFSQDGRVASEVSPVGVYDWISQEVRGHGVSLSPREIESIARGSKTRPLDFKVADALVTSIGHTEAFYDGTLTVRTRGDRPGRSSLLGS